MDFLNILMVIFIEVSGDKHYVSGEILPVVLLVRDSNTAPIESLSDWVHPLLVMYMQCIENAQLYA